MQPASLGLLVSVICLAGWLSAAGASVREEVAARIHEARSAATKTHSARSLPIGVFDSGTGGLAVLEQILRLDQFNNQTHAALPAGDQCADFAAEQFVFLGDQANMPYGNYPALGKRACLVDLVLNDAAFLLDNQYYPSTQAKAPAHDKLPVKAIIIACNTATAYGKSEIDKLIGEANVPVKVIGIIQGGALGVKETLASATSATVGVIATRGTCASGAYPSAIAEAAQARGLKVCVVQRGSLGLAGAIDGVRDFILSDAPSDQPRPEYRGPSFTNEQDHIEAALLPRYHFDFSKHQVLWSGEQARPTALQLNSIENYIAYETVELVESLRRNPPAQPLSVVVLGCTHFPYFASAFAAQFKRLRDYQEDGQYIYRALLAEDIRLIDPAVLAAKELYACLAAEGKLNETAPGKSRGQFFITVPNPSLAPACLDASGGFAYEYKYGRVSELGAKDFLAVPLTVNYFPATMSQRLQRQLPNVWSLLQGFTTAQP